MVCRCLGFLRSCAWSVELSSTSIGIWRRFVRNGNLVTGERIWDFILKFILELTGDAIRV